MDYLSTVSIKVYQNSFIHIDLRSRSHIQHFVNKKKEIVTKESQMKKFVGFEPRIEIFLLKSHLKQASI